MLTFGILYMQATPPKAISGTSLAAKPAAVPVAKAKLEAPVSVEAEFEFSDVTALTCLLCARQFKTMDQLKRHNKESDLHKARLPQCCVLSSFRDWANPAFCSFFPGFLLVRLPTNRKTSRIRIYEMLHVRRWKYGRQQRGPSQRINPSIVIGHPSAGYFLTSPTLRHRKRTPSPTRRNQLMDHLRLLRHLPNPSIPDRMSPMLGINY